MEHWYVVHTQPNREARAVEHLARQGIGAYVPRYAKRRRHARRVDTVAVALFPGYAFVRLDPGATRWRSINGTIGVNHLLCHGGRPASLPDGMVAALRRQEDENGLHSAASLMHLAPGARFRVVDGAFEDHVGTFERMTADERVVLLLDVLGRAVRVKLPLADIDAA